MGKVSKSLKSREAVSNCLSGFFIISNSLNYCNRINIIKPGIDCNCMLYYNYNIAFILMYSIKVKKSMVILSICETNDV